MTKKEVVKNNAFVSKLYTMLRDPKLLHLIWWTDSEDENIFALYPDKEFAQALTGYFKHGNVASFVRQLHMYGFHKVSDPNISQLDKDCQQIWEFKHSLGKFKKNDEDSLIHIKRRSTSNYQRNNSQEVDYDLKNQIQGLRLYYGYEEGHGVQYVHPMYQGIPPGMPVPSGIPLGMPMGLPLGLNGQYVQPAANSHPPLIHSQSQQQLHQHPHQMAHHSLPLPPHQHPSIPRHHQSLPHPSQPQAHPAPPHPAQPTSSPQQIPNHQEHTPQFRKVWESSDGHRPRNPSLLYDPLAPIPIKQGQPAPPQPQHHQPPPQQQQSKYLPPHYYPISTSAPSSISGGIRTTPTPQPSNVDKSPYDSTRSSIKLPPPSFVNRASSLKSEIPSSPSSVGNMLKKPSLIPLSNSFHEILRPSLIDLHYGNGSNNNTGTNSNSGNNSIANSNILNKTNVPRDSLTSISSKPPSIFSNKSSIGSFSSFQRTSSFGSISLPPTKASFSVGPHDPIEQTPHRLSQQHNPQEVNVNTSQANITNQIPNLERASSLDHKIYSPPHSLLKLASKSIASPIPRSSTSIPTSTATPTQFNKIYRSMTTSPLSISVPKTIKETDEPKNTMVSITSLLDNSSKLATSPISNSKLEQDDSSPKRRKLS